MTTDIQIIPYGSDAYMQLLALRDLELRVPLGLKFTPEELAKDEVDTHIAALDDGKVIGGVIVMLHDDGKAQLRQMVVSSTLQRGGIGQQLLRYAEAFIAEKDMNRIELNARTNAQNFYEKVGYEIEGEVFTQATLPHIRMIKQLR